MASHLVCPSMFEGQPEHKAQAIQPKTEARPNGISMSETVFPGLETHLVIAIYVPGEYSANVKRRGNFGRMISQTQGVCTLLSFWREDRQMPSLSSFKSIIRTYRQSSKNQQEVVYD